MAAVLGQWDLEDAESWKKKDSRPEPRRGGILSHKGFLGHFSVFA